MSIILASFLRGVDSPVKPERQELKIEYYIGEPWVQGDKTYVDINAKLLIKRDQRYPHVKDTRANKYWELNLYQDGIKVKSSGNKYIGVRAPQSIYNSYFTEITHLEYRASWSNIKKSSTFSFGGYYHYKPGFSTKLTNMNIPLQAGDQGRYEQNTQMNLTVTRNTPITKLTTPVISSIFPTNIPFNGIVTVNWQEVMSEINNKVSQYKVLWKKGRTPSLTDYDGFILTNSKTFSQKIDLKGILPENKVYFGVQAIGSTSNKDFWSSLGISNTFTLINKKPEIQAKVENFKEIDKNNYLVPSTEQKVTIKLWSNEKVIFYQYVDGLWKGIGTNKNNDNNILSISINLDENKAKTLIFKCNDNIEDSNSQTINITKNEAPIIQSILTDKNLLQKTLTITMNKKIKKDFIFNYKIIFNSKEGNLIKVDVIDEIKQDILDISGIPSNQYHYTFKDIRFYAPIDFSNIVNYKIQVFCYDGIEDSSMISSEIMFFPQDIEVAKIRSNENEDTFYHNYLNFYTDLFFYYEKKSFYYDTLEQISYSSFGSSKLEGTLNFESFEIKSDDKNIVFHITFPPTLKQNTIYDFVLKLKNRSTGFSKDIKIDHFITINPETQKQESFFLRRVPEINNIIGKVNQSHYKPYTQTNGYLTFSWQGGLEENFLDYKNNLSLSQLNLILYFKENVFFPFDINNNNIFSKEGDYYLVNFSYKNFYEYLIKNNANFTLEDLNKENNCSFYLEFVNYFGIIKTLPVYFKQDSNFIIDFREPVLLSQENNVPQLDLYFQDNKFPLGEKTQNFNLNKESSQKVDIYEEKLNFLEQNNLFLKEGVKLFARGEIKSYNYDFSQIKSDISSISIEEQADGNFWIETTIKKDTPLTLEKEDLVYLYDVRNKEEHQCFFKGEKIVEESIIYSFLSKNKIIINADNFYQIIVKQYFLKTALQVNRIKPNKKEDNNFNNWISYKTELTFSRKDDGTIPSPGKPFTFSINQNLKEPTQFFHTIQEINEKEGYEVNFCLSCYNKTMQSFLFFNDNGSITVKDTLKYDIKFLKRFKVIRHVVGRNDLIKIDLLQQQDASFISGRIKFSDLGIDIATKKVAENLTIITNISSFLVIDSLESNDFYDEKQYSENNGYINFKIGNFIKNNDWNCKFVRIKVVVNNYIKKKNIDQTEDQILVTQKTYFSNNLALYNIAPLVSYRSNKIGINSNLIDDFRNRDAVLSINQSGQNKKIYFRGINLDENRNSTEVVSSIDLSTQEVNGFIIQSDSWDLEAGKVKFITSNTEPFQTSKNQQVYVNRGDE